MRVVVDTNIFFSSFFGGKPRAIIDQWKLGNIILCLSGPILDEYLEVLKRAFDTEPELDEIISLLLQGYQSVFAAETTKLKILNTDPDDIKFIECAVETGAQFIITGDKDLLRIKRYGNIEIVSPGDFLQKHTPKKS